MREIVFLRLKSLFISIEKRTPRMFFAIIGTLLARFPFFSFQIAVANLQKKTISQDHFAIPCISDCRVYGELSMGIDRPGHFTWTYFPVWPNLIRIFKDSLPLEISGYSAAVILSWIVGILSGCMILLFFDQYWESDRKYFGFAKKSWIISLLFSIYPHGHFWFQGYSEPLFVLVLLSGLYLIAFEKIVLGGLFIGLSAVIRPQGVWLVPIWSMILLWRAYYRKISWSRALFSILISSIGGLFLLEWYWKGTGDLFYYYKIQGVYGRSFSLIEGIWNHRPRFDTAVLYLYLSLIGSISLIRRNDFVSQLIGWFCLAFTEVPLFFGGFYSYVRFLSVSLALFIFLTYQFEKSRLRESLIVLFFMTKLAIQVYKSGFHEWVG